MKVTKLIMVFAIALLIAACGGDGGSPEKTNSAGDNSEKTNTATEESSSGGENELALKIRDDQKKFDPTSSFAFVRDMKVTKSVDSQMVDDGDASRTIIVLANYELDTSDQIDSIDRQKVDKPEMIKLKFELHGEKDTNGKSPIKVGEYVFTHEGGYSRLNGIQVYHLNEDGKEEELMLGKEGKVVITSVDDKTIKGEIDVTAVNGSLKGSFSTTYERLK